MKKLQNSLDININTHQTCNRCQENKWVKSMGEQKSWSTHFTCNIFHLRQLIRLESKCKLTINRNTKYTSISPNMIKPAQFRKKNVQKLKLKPTVICNSFVCTLHCVYHSCGKQYIIINSGNIFQCGGYVQKTYDYVNNFSLIVCTKILKWIHFWQNYKKSK